LRLSSQVFFCSNIRVLEVRILLLRAEFCNEYGACLLFCYPKDVKQEGGIIIIDRLALGIAQQMIQEEVISAGEKDDYVYVITMYIEKAISISSIIIMSIMVGQLIPSFCFLVCFWELRKRTGGYHARTFWACYMETMLVYMAVVRIADFFIIQPVIMYGSLLVACCVLAGIGAINHPNIHMELRELALAKKSARITLTIEVGVILMLQIIGNTRVIVSYMITAIFLCALSICLAKIIGQEVKMHEED